MTHCLDCGSQRSSDQCPVCGLTSAAAELVFRRRLIRQMAVFLASSLLFPYISQIYPPLDIDAMLVFFGLIFFFGLVLAIVLESRARARKEIEVLRHLFTGLIPIPIILSLALFSERQAGLAEGRGVPSSGGGEPLPDEGRDSRNAAAVCAILAARPAA